MNTDWRARLRNELLWELRSNEWDREVLPHYGLVPDWYPRYKRLAQLIEEYLDNEGSKLATQQQQTQAHERNQQRETKSS